MYSILRLGVWGPPPAAQSGDHNPTAIGPTAHLAAPLPSPGHTGAPLTKNSAARARRSRWRCVDPVLARRCRGGDISRFFLAHRNQWPCRVGPCPRPTPCTPGPGHIELVSPFQLSRIFGSHARIHWGTRHRWTAPALRYLPSNPDIWTTVSGTGTDIFRMHAGSTHGKPRAARCNFCPMRPCRTPHTPPRLPR